MRRVAHPQATAAGMTARESLQAISASLTRLRVCVRVDRDLSAEDLAQQKVAYLDALQRFSPAAVDAACRASAAESEWWPPLKRLLALAREHQAAEAAALALPAPGSAAVTREDFLARCARLGFAVGTMRTLGHDRWWPLFEAHMRDALEDEVLVAGLRRLQQGQPLRAERRVLPVSVVAELAARLRAAERSGTTRSKDEEPDP
jgi:hypothetical protein